MGQQNQDTYPDDIDLIRGNYMQSEPNQAPASFLLTQAAQEFASEIAGTAERKKKTLPAPAGLQTFLLYVRANGYVPVRQVSGPITIQGILGHSRIQTPEQTYELTQGSLLSLAAGGAS